MNTPPTTDTIEGTYLNDAGRPIVRVIAVSDEVAFVTLRRTDKTESPPIASIWRTWFPDVPPAPPEVKAYLVAVRPAKEGDWILNHDGTKSKASYWDVYPASNRRNVCVILHEGIEADIGKEARTQAAEREARTGTPSPIQIRWQAPR